MNVPSFTFLAYGVAGAILYNLARRWPARRYILLALNLAFLASFARGPRSLVPYAVFIATGWLAMVAARRNRSLATMWALIALVLAELCYLKRYGFVPQQIGLGFAYVTVGFSYVFFRVLHLVIEARDDPDSTPRSIVSYLNYTLQFPALVSGPIQFYRDYHLAEEAGPRLAAPLIGIALWRICLGFFKVVVVASALQYVRSQELSVYLGAADWIQSALHGAILVALYPLFLYANFSGYVDFVIGVARLYGFELPENFEKPFSSENFIIFWSRWHITLSNWLKTYVYTPLLMGCMRRWDSTAIEPYFAVLAYFVTFFLVGVWHGQTAMFLVFGVLQGGGVAVNKLYQIQLVRLLGNKVYKHLRDNPLYRAAARGLTFTWFAFTLIWFWASSSDFARLYHAGSALSVSLALCLIWGGATVILATLSQVDAPLRTSRILSSRYTLCALATLMVLIVLCSLFIVGTPPPEIVYKQF